MKRTVCRGAPSRRRRGRARARPAGRPRRRDRRERPRFAANARVRCARARSFAARGAVRRARHCDVAGPATTSARPGRAVLLSRRRTGTAVGGRDVTATDGGDGAPTRKQNAHAQPPTWLCAPRGEGIPDGCALLPVRAQTPTWSRIRPVVRRECAIPCARTTTLRHSSRATRAPLPGRGRGPRPSHTTSPVHSRTPPPALRQPRARFRKNHAERAPCSSRPRAVVTPPSATISRGPRSTSGPPVECESRGRHPAKGAAATRSRRAGAPGTVNSCVPARPAAAAPTAGGVLESDVRPLSIIVSNAYFSDSTPPAAWGNPAPLGLGWALQSS